MSRRVRLALLLPSLGGVAALLAWSFADLPAFGRYRGPYGPILNRIVTPERHVTNVVAGTVFDVRGIDTLGEEFILLAAVTGVVLLLRSSGEERERAPADSIRSDALSAAAPWAAGTILLVALWLTAFGYVTPGGGFQGGVVAAGAFLLVYLAGSRRDFRRFGREELLDPIEGAGALAFASLGVAALASGAAFLHNLLGHGTSGTLWSGGSVPLLNWATAVEVAAANLVLANEFLEQYLIPLARRLE